MALTLFHDEFPIWLLMSLGAWLIAWHSSLQHEIVHGHPTRWQNVNRALAFIPLSLWLPYGRYRALHLAHHSEDHLTDPLEDPESYYWTPEDWAALSRAGRLLVRLQTTLMGRLILGPAWTVGRFLAQETWPSRAGVRARLGAHLGTWAAHLLGCVAILAWVVGVCGMSPWLYLFGIVYPGTSLLLIRSFVEHRAAGPAPERTAIVENARILGPLFLFNNLHVVHHDRPDLPWYRIPREYQERRESLIAKNGGLVYDSYLDVARRFLFAPHDNPVHPLARSP